MSVLIKTRAALRSISSDIEVTKIGKAFCEFQRISECFVEGGLQAPNVSYESLSGHLADQVTHKWKKCEWERNKWKRSVIEVKHKWFLSVPELQKSAECPR